ncbi:hypothetical protein COV11_00860 [Candidatus Woesearchaeota archaeon CG10_big_fil_rev_8_21_14_0_10_30_7]|nr:MAG: hypothetical protein COV11_00860 [Candidatus Woesearchaeota archaeon CG10_big_fil_rev_8_21_14_0_10_30_7]
MKNVIKQLFETLKKRYIVIGTVSGLGFFLLFGIITSIIPTSLFIRMTRVTLLDWFFLSLSSILIGTYVSVHLYKKKTTKNCNMIATTGGIGSFFAFACPICNKLLVLLVGTTALMTYFEPYQPILGFASNGLLAGALYWRIKT